MAVIKDVHFHLIGSRLSILIPTKINVQSVTTVFVRAFALHKLPFLPAGKINKPNSSPFCRSLCGHTRIWSQRIAFFRKILLPSRLAALLEVKRVFVLVKLTWHRLNWSCLTSSLFLCCASGHYARTAFQTEFRCRDDIAILGPTLTGTLLFGRLAVTLQWLVIAVLVAFGN